MELSPVAHKPLLLAILRGAPHKLRCASAPAAVSCCDKVAAVQQVPARSVQADVSCNCCMAYKIAHPLGLTGAWAAAGLGSIEWAGWVLQASTRNAEEATACSCLASVLTAFLPASHTCHAKDVLNGFGGRVDDNHTWSSCGVAVVLRRASSHLKSCCAASRPCTYVLPAGHAAM